MRRPDGRQAPGDDRSSIPGEPIPLDAIEEGVRFGRSKAEHRAAAVLAVTDFDPFSGTAGLYTGAAVAARLGGLDPGGDAVFARRRRESGVGQLRRGRRASAICDPDTPARAITVPLYGWLIAVVFAWLLVLLLARQDLAGRGAPGRSFAGIITDIYDADTAYSLYGGRSVAVERPRNLFRPRWFVAGGRQDCYIELTYVVGQF